jgi:hypothetical protein
MPSLLLCFLLCVILFFYCRRKPVVAKLKSYITTDSQKLRFIVHIWIPMTVAVKCILSLIMWYHAGCYRFNDVSEKPAFSNFMIEPEDGSSNIYTASYSKRTRLSNCGAMLNCVM